jgi:hypothetical protein
MFGILVRKLPSTFDNGEDIGLLDAAVTMTSGFPEIADPVCVG